MNAITDNKPATAAVKHRRRLPTELSIFLVLIGIGLVFEVFGWIVRVDPTMEHGGRWHGPSGFGLRL